jgi:excisionase family DNA binding protein
MKRATRATKEKEEYWIVELSGLSVEATDFLRRRPREARMAVTAALESAAARSIEPYSGPQAEELESTECSFILDRHLLSIIAATMGGLMSSLAGMDIDRASRAWKAIAPIEEPGDPSSLDVPEPLKPFIDHSAQGQDVIGVSEAAARLKVSRTTIYDWVIKSRLLAWKSTKRGLTIPAEQILGPGKVVAGLARVLETIDDPELAWAFLTQDWPFANDTARPLDKLAGGELDDVVSAAASFGMSFA